MQWCSLPNKLQPNEHYRIPGTSTSVVLCNFFFPKLHLLLKVWNGTTN